MTEQVMLKIAGLQSAGENNTDAIETEMVATYCCDNNVHIVRYEEAEEDTQEKVFCTISFTENHLEVLKEGGLNTCLVFEEGDVNVAEYDTNVGRLMLGISTKKIDVQETEDRILVQVSYSLQCEYETVADCKVTITILAIKNG